MKREEQIEAAASTGRFGRTGWGVTRKERAFWEKVNKTDTCWLWTGWINSSGYGNFVFERKIYGAHRFSIELSGQTIANGWVVDHACRNRACINPDHLRVVTEKTNILQNSDGASARNAVKTHCKKGHLLSGDNLMVQFNNKAKTRIARRCRTCERAQFKKYWKRKNEQKTTDSKRSV